MYLGHHAREAPCKLALIVAESGEQITYDQLERQSIRVAYFLRIQGLRPGDQVAVYMQNVPEYLAIAWAALRSGLYLTPLNTYLTLEEIAYIVNDCGAKALFGSGAFSDTLRLLEDRIPRCTTRVLVPGALRGWHDYRPLVAHGVLTAAAEESVGAIHCYSSGTTGRPKGVRLARGSWSVEKGVQRDAAAYARAYHLTSDTVYMTPAPLFHSAALHFSIAVHGQGGTVVLLRKFDPVLALEAMERHRVTHTQWVPTMFARLLKVPKQQREGYDLSNHELALHGGAPCRIELKRQMLQWWGSIILEAYGCTELYGLTVIGAEDWLRHPGSVGRSVLGRIHICDDCGVELPPRTAGNIYFEGEQARSFRYTNDPEKTRAARHPAHAAWATVGDMGYLDEEGYLYLTDRRDFMIISGGINISPQAVEDALGSHSQVDDVAVLGVPNEEMGQEVKAIVQLTDGVAATPELARELIEYARGRVARHMVPRSVEFVSALPRLPNGKLYKRKLQDHYRSRPPVSASEAGGHS
jgi:fatty-acyl-CoA synthase